MTKLVGLPLPGIGNAVTAAFFRNCVRAVKGLGNMKQIAVSIDATAIQYQAGSLIPATSTYHLKVALAKTIESMFNVWVKASVASVAIEETRSFYSADYGISVVDGAQMNAFAANLPDAYFLGGTTSVGINVNPATGKMYTGMRFFRIDGETAVTQFTLPKTAGAVFPYIGRPEAYLTGSIPENSMPLIFTSSNAAGTVVKSYVPVRFKGKMTELLPASATTTARQASYFDACAAAVATHFVIYDHSNSSNVVITIETRSY
jgi:hypothetical protein